MTIYLVQWRDTADNNVKKQQAFSSVTNAEKKVREILKDKDLQVIIDDEEGTVRTLRPKTQADVINLINSL